MTVLHQRFAFGIPILGAVIGLLLWDQSTDGLIGVGILAAVFGLGAIGEFSRMFKLPRRLEVGATLLLVGMLGARTVALSLSDTGHLEIEFYLLALSPGFLVILCFREAPDPEVIREAGTALFGALYIGLPLACLLELSAGTRWGVGGLIFLVLVVKANDSGAYLIGRKWGKTPLAKISPNKTREGSLGGIAAGIVCALAVVALDATAPLGYPWAAGVGLGIGVAGQFGDLLESYLKRAAGVKDSGGLIPAFGGVLDLLDSLLLAGPVMLAITQWGEVAWNS